MGGLPHCSAKAIALVATVALALVSSAAQAGPSDRLTRRPFSVTADPASHIPRNWGAAQIAMRADGAFVVVWISPRGIVARRFMPDGTPYGDEILTGASGAPLGVAVAADFSFVVAWLRPWGHILYPALIKARVWDGTPSGRPRTDVIDVTAGNVAAYDTSPVSVAIDPIDGHFAVAWSGPHSLTAGTCYVRTFDGDGSPIKGPFMITAPPATLHSRCIPRIAMSHRGLVAVRAQAKDSLGPFDLRAKLLTREGHALTDFAVASSNATEGELGAGFDVALGANGDIVVAYRRHPLDEGPDAGTIYARRFTFDPAAPLRGREIRVASGQSLRGNGVAVDVDEHGDFALAWDGEPYLPRGPFLVTRLYRSGGIPVTRTEAWPFAGLKEPPSSISVGIANGGAFTTAFQTSVRDPDGSTRTTVLTQAFAGVDDTRLACDRYIATKIGTSRSETIYGTAGDDVIRALGGNDIVNGLGGDDVICGDDGDDVLYGGAGNDVIHGGAGDDVIDGGEGWDQCNGNGQTNADTAVQCEGVSSVP